MKILVVEDSPRWRKPSWIIWSWPVTRVDCAYHGQAALQLLAEQRFDVIIMDVMMPRLDGLRTVEPALGRHLHPVIFLTARDSLEDKLAGFQGGRTTTWSSRSPWRELEVRLQAWACAAPLQVTWAPSASAT